VPDLKAQGYFKIRRFPMKKQKTLEHIWFGQHPFILVGLCSLLSVDDGAGVALLYAAVQPATR
jgi:hypothetical protein